MAESVLDVASSPLTAIMVRGHEAGATGTALAAPDVLISNINPARG
jgi:hypothetical protein